jgi:poly(beta-D-mannuronate) lyase
MQNIQRRSFERCCMTALFIASAATALGEPLRSPWDAVTIAATDAPYNCPATPPLARTIEIGTYYIDAKASVIDPQKKAAFDKASEAPTRLEQLATLAADAYQSNGSSPAATCTYTLLAAAAKADAWAGKMPSFSGVYVQNWLLSGVGVAYLKVRHSGTGTTQQDMAIQRWLNHLSDRVREYFDDSLQYTGSDGYNNHIYWAGLAVAAAGIATNDRVEFNWGIAAYRQGLQAIQPDGTLRAELARGQMALHYHLYALGPLIMLAEMGEANGIAIYAEDHGAIHRLVSFCLTGLEDPKRVEQLSGAPQVVSLPYAGSDIGWAVPYVRRFPNAQLSALLAKAPWVRSTQWGGTPPP